MPEPESETVTCEALWRFEFQRERHLAISRVAKGITRNLRGCRGHPDLVLVIEAQFRGHFAGALPGLNDIAFGKRGRD